MKKKTKTLCKILSVFLAFLIVAQILPLQVLAENIANILSNQETTNTLSEDNSDIEILYEVKEKRDEHTKVYKKSDGSYTAIKTEDALHYLDDGVWEEINNSMALKGNHYTNIDNLFNVEFPKSIDSNENLTIEKDGYELSFSVDNIEESSAVVENDLVVSDTNILVADEAISQTQSSVTYNDVDENTDLQYIITPNSIKENLIVSNKESVKDRYTFTFETNGLITEKYDDGSVVFKSELDEIKFRIPRPVMTDASFAFSYDINVILIENTDGTITLEYSPSSDWTNSTDRIYPITIDPAIVSESDETYFIEDTCVEYNSDKPEITDQNNADASLAAVINMLTGENKDGTTTTFDSEVYTRINTDYFKNLGDNIIFTEVQYLARGITTVNGKLFARDILEDWDVHTVTYNTKPELSNEVIDYYTSPLNEGEEFDNLVFIHFNITEIFNEWFNGKTNNGFAITAAENAVAFMLINGGSNNTAMVVDYVDLGGYNENLNYHTQSAGRAGTGYVNDFTQHLSVIRDDIYVDDNNMPVTIGMVYDSATYDKAVNLNHNSILAYGNNWIPNYLRVFLQGEDNKFTYYTETGAAIDYIRSTDENGEIIFKEIYSDTYGNHGYELEYHPASNGKNEYYTINRPDGYIEKFDRNGLLISVTKLVYIEEPPANENEQPTLVCTEQSITVQYDGSGRINCITDHVGRVYDYVYSNNLLSKITYHTTDDDNSSPLEIIYTYDENNNLTEVTFPDNKSIEYEYNDNNDMTSMENIDNYRIIYQYVENTYFNDSGEEIIECTDRVANATEQAKNGTTYENGNSITYERLNTYQIKLTDASGDYELYHFGAFGNLLYTIDSNGNYVMHEDVDSTDETHFASVSDYRAFSENLLSNPSFEEIDSNGSLKNWETPKTTSMQSNEKHALFGTKVLKISSDENESVNIKQSVDVISGGKYTFSAYVFSEELTNPLTLKLYYDDMEQDCATTSVTTTNGNWERYIVTLDAPSDIETITVELTTANGATFYIDGVQLEQSTSASLYNYIQNGSFNNGLNHWTTTTDLDFEKSTINGETINALILPGKTNDIVEISQTVAIDGKRNDIIRVGGWFKGFFTNSSTNNVLLKNLKEELDDPKICNFTNDRKAKIKVVFEKTNTNSTQTIEISLNENLDNWQFAARDISLNNDYNQATITIHYSNNVNTALLSNVELTKTKIRTTTYDSGEKQCPCVNCTVINCPCNCDSQNYCFCSQCILEDESVNRDAFGNITLGNNYDEIITVQMLTQRIGNNVTVNYKLSNALLESVYDATNSNASYTYDNSGTLTQISADGNIVNFTYENDKITSINQNGTIYKLNYDSWGQLTQVSIGDNSIVSYQYDSGEFRDRIIQVTYHNNTALSITKFDYNDDKNTITISINDNKQFTCKYDENSTLTKIIEENGREIYYIDDRTEIINAEGNQIYSFDTDTNGNIVETIDNIKYTTELLGASKSYYYEDGTNVITTNGKNVSTVIEADIWGRYVSSTVLTQSLTNTGSLNINSAIIEFYEYCDEESNLIATHNSYILDSNIIVGNELIPNYITNYEYDSKGNVVKETVKDNLHEKDISCTNYVYNNLNQLIRVNKKVYNNSSPVISAQNSYTYTYEYNNSGNICCKKVYDYTMDADLSTHTTIKTIDYQYDANGVWKDKLVAYGDTSITYDNIGNPTIIENSNTNVTQRFTWRGRELDEYDDGNKFIKYEYDASGQCYRKTVLENGKEIESFDYIWSGGKLISQIYNNGTTTYVMKFIYDILNTPYGFILSYYNNQENVNPKIHENIYLFIKNMKGDIIGIVNESRNTVLTYEYDVWGVTTTNIDTGVNDILKNIADILPLRYRGYFYDNDTGLYYIQGRYYNPEMCRFINADSTSNLGYNGMALNYNLYTYCKNNPVMYVIDNKDTSFSNTINSNYFYNKRIAKGLSGYIDDQNNGIASKLRYGLSTIGPLGCGWVATYNALIMLGNRLEPCDIIQNFEMNNLPFNGLFGTSIHNIARFFVEKDYDVTITYLEDYDLTNTNDLETVHSLVKQENTVHILLYKNSGFGHYIALKYNGTDIQNNDIYITYNENTNNNGVANSIKEFIPSNSKAHTLISISTK